MKRFAVVCALVPVSLAVVWLSPAGEAAASAGRVVTPAGRALAAGAVTVTSTALPNGQVSAPYYFQLTASGGTPPYTWSVGSPLPAGLYVSSAGVVSGTPTTAGSGSANVIVTDSKGSQANGSLPYVIGAETDWLQPAYDQSQNTFNPDEVSITPANVTELKLEWTDPGGTDEAPVVSGGFTYGSCYDQTEVCRIDLSTGDVSWHEGFASGTPSAWMVLGQGVLLLQVAGVLTALDPVTGAQLWSAPSGVPADSGIPVISGSSAYLVDSGSDAVYAVSLANGQRLWQANVTGTDAFTGQGLAVSGNEVLATVSNSSGGAVYALSTSSGQRQWRTAIKSQVISPAFVTISGSSAYVTGSGSDGGALYVLSTSSGTMQWHKSLQGEGESPAVVGGGLVYAGSGVDDGDGVIQAFNATTGKQAWETDAGRQFNPYALADGILFDDDYDFQELIAYSAQTGAQLWQTSLGGQGGAVIVVDGRVLLQTANGLEAYSLGPSQPVITTGYVLPAHVGTAYRTTLAATHGTKPYTWSISAGSLPAGLALNASTGKISGTPTAAGTAVVTIQLTDGAGKVATRQITFEVDPTGASDWPGYRYDPANDGENPYEQDISVSTAGQLTQKWSATTAGQTDGGMVVAGGTVFVNGQTSKIPHLVALNASTGNQLWTVANTQDSPPVVSGDVVYVDDSDGSISAHQTSDGSQLWKSAKINATPYCTNTGTSPPQVAGTLLYSGSSNGGLYALNLSDGKTAWHAATNSATSCETPAVSNGVVYATDNTDVYAFDATSGKALWSQSFPDGLIESSPVVADGTLYVSDWDVGLLALDPATGNLLWQASDVQPSATGDPAVAYGLVFLDDEGGSLVAIDAHTGLVVWSGSPTGDYIGQSQPAVADGVVFRGDINANITAYDIRNGNVVFSDSRSSQILATPAVSNGYLYIADGDEVVAYTRS
jgi:outer membrane protein assembly factor BamB